MKAHIQQTIADLEADRARLDETIAALKRYGNGEGERPPSCVGAPAFRASARPRSVRRRAASEESAPRPAGAPAGRDRKPSRNIAIVHELVSIADEPFIAGDIIRRLEKRLPELSEEQRTKLVSNFLYVFENRGHIEKDATQRPYKFSRGATFESTLAKYAAARAA